MADIEMASEDVAAAVAAIKPGREFFMLNLLRFRDQADYGGQDFPPATGREAYLQRYVPAFAEVAGPLGGSDLIFAGDVFARLVGPEDEVWDVVAIAHYPNIKVFQDITSHPKYLTKAAPHRRAALADLRLIATTALG